jgi:hypothetical protein
MTREELIHKLTVSGMLTELYKAGLIGFKPLMYRDIYYHYQTEITVKHRKKLQAAKVTAAKFGVDLSTVYRAKQFFNPK